MSQPGSLIENTPGDETLVLKIAEMQFLPSLLEEEPSDAYDTAEEQDVESKLSV